LSVRVQVLGFVVAAAGCASPRAAAPHASAPPVVPEARAPVAFRVIQAAPRRFAHIECAEYAGRLPGGVDPEKPFAPHLVDESSDPALWARCQKLASDQREKGAELACFSTTEGALWVISRRGPQAEGDYASWHLVYQPLKGAAFRTRAVAAAIAPGDDPAIAGNDITGPPIAVAVADLDGDGRSELLTTSSTPTDVSGHVAETIEVWSTDKRGIVSFPAAQGHALIDLTDIDDDGHLELLEDPYGATFGSSYGWQRAQPGWSLLLELDAKGQLSDAGPRSQQWARQLCPTADELLEWLPKQDPSCLAQYAHCARLWGLAPEAVDAALGLYCKEEGDDPSGWCSGSLGSWSAIAHAKPPFVLKPLPAGAPAP